MFTGRIGSNRSKSFEEPAINITPLVDVVFVLLISFILVAPLLETDSVELAGSGGAPTHTPMRSQDESPLAIHVLKDNSILIQGRKVTLNQLPQAILEIQRRFPKAKPQLFQDKRAFFGVYQEIKNCLEHLGYSEMEIILNP